MSQADKDFFLPNRSDKTVYEQIYNERPNSAQEAFETEQNLFGFFALLRKIQERELKKQAEETGGQQ